MRRSKLLGFIAATAGAGALVCGLVSCLADPRADEAVVVTDTCDLAALATEPTSPQATLRTYVESTQSLVDTANSVEVDLIGACNAIETELGLPAATDLGSACKALSARISAVNARAPAQAGLNIVADWVQIGFAPKCEAPANALESCLSTCAGPCDSTKCEEGKLAARCDGACKGTCSTTGDQVACNGQCVGEAPVTAATCQGECVGLCLGRAWTGQCEGSCAAAFVGVCGGTCTGTCDGVSTGTGGDGGTDSGADSATDGGTEGGADAAPPAPPSGVPPRPPSGADGNCNGTCRGVCSDKAYGDCKAACATYKDDGTTVPAKYSGGICSNGVCSGSCRSAKGTGSTTTCTGACTALAEGACGGLCRGQCEGTTREARCEGALNCGQNAECNNACQAKALLQTKCEEPRLLQLYSVSDPVLYAAISKHSGKLGKAITQLAYLRSAFGFVGNRTYGDFTRIGLSGDLTRACVAKGRANVDTADVKIRALLAADATTRKYQ